MSIVKSGPGCVVIVFEVGVGGFDAWLLRRFLASFPFEFRLLRRNWPMRSFSFLKVPSEAFIS